MIEKRKEAVLYRADKLSCLKGLRQESGPKRLETTGAGVAVLCT